LSAPQIVIWLMTPDPNGKQNFLHTPPQG